MEVGMKIPVYLITGFLEAGKTRFIQETLMGQSLETEGNTLLVICEEGIEEFDPTAFAVPDVYCETVDEEDELSEERLLSLSDKHKPTLIIIE